MAAGCRSLVAGRRVADRAPLRAIPVPARGLPRGLRGGRAPARRCARGRHCLVSMAGMLLFSLLPAAAAGLTPRAPLLLLPVLEDEKPAPFAIRLIELLQQAPESVELEPLSLERAHALLAQQLLPASPGSLQEAELRRLTEGLEQGKEAFLMNRFQAAVEQLEGVRQQAIPLLNRAAHRSTGFNQRLFHGLMILGRSLDALGDSERSQELYRWLVRAMPGEPVEADRYPPSLVSRYASLRAEAGASTGTVLIEVDGQVPTDPDGCLVYLDGTVRGTIGSPLVDIPTGEYRGAVICREGLQSRDYRIQVVEGRVGRTVFLGDDAAIELGGGTPGLLLGRPWQEHDYLGPALASSKLAGVPLLLLCGPGQDGAMLDLVLVDGPGRRVLSRRSLARRELPAGPDGASELLSDLLAASRRHSSVSGPGDAPPPGPAAQPLRTAAWITGGAALAAAITGLAFGLQQREELDEAETCQQDYSCRHSAELDVLQDRASSRALVANVSFGVAGAAAVSAVVLFLLSRSSDHVTPQSPDGQTQTGYPPAVSLLPAFTAGGPARSAGCLVGWRF